MIDALDEVMPTVAQMAPDQLRTLIAHAAGLHAHSAGGFETSRVLYRVGDALLDMGCTSMREIATATALKHGHPLDDLRSPSRCRPLAHARWEAMWLMRQVKRPDGTHRYSFPQIGRYFGGRDHTTVMHGVREYAKRRGGCERARAA